MFGRLGFSYVGLIFLLCLFIPNLLYAKNLPVDQRKISENKILLAFERTGQVLCTVLVVSFQNFNFYGLDIWTIWLLAACILMLLYLFCWGRYFHGGHVSSDFLRPFLGVPLPLAVLPVAAFLCLAVYGKMIWLLLAVLVLAVGHIGITWQYWRVIHNS